MKNIRNNIDKWLERLDKRWDELPIKKQHQYVRYFFTAYLLLTTVVILNVCFTTARSQNDLDISHIESTTPSQKKSSPALQDSIKLILKNNIYERK